MRLRRFVFRKDEAAAAFVRRWLDGRRRPADLLELIEATPPGRQLWVRGAGRSLYPLLRSGDSVRVLRCAPEELARGDVALVRVGRRLLAHVVISDSAVA